MKETFWYWIFQILCGSIRFLWHFVLSLKYGGKGKVVPPVTNPLLLKSATQLAREIREGKVKSEKVVQAYLDRIQEVEPYINATAERCFEDALKKAREVDSLVASGSRSREYWLKEKPLLGVPFSVKLLFMVKGLPCTAGCKPFEKIIAIRDAPAVALMKKAGAILITSTNVPELAADLETTNNLYGRTRNPYDTNRTSGGTSGGEAALIAAGGSVLGLGNDSLGSLRIPAHFTGIFSHKPTRALVPNQGCFPPEMPDKLSDLPQPEICKIVSVGPMCRYAEDLIISMKILASKSGIRTDFDKQVDFRKIKICYLREIQSPGVPPVHKDIANALKKAVSHFENRYNITAREVKMPFLYDASRCIMSTLHRYVKNVKETFLCGKDLGFNEKIDFLKSFIGKSVLRFSSLVIINSSCFTDWYMKDRTSYYEKMLEEWTTEFDKLLDENTVLLMPVSPVITPYHFETIPLVPIICYSGIFNVLGLPATHCPMGFTRKGLPYGIQIVGRANNDALTIACAVELERAFGGWKSPGEL
ncbi:Fatty-acid amide hydrolase 2-A [Araneus ventricosus]|uniref:Fatty-acid amide hydrolase 2-A n=1 Tax=Araneus ventricosus TaxID=182803 RepID=A0A4Y2BS38_ARAVE|nr:Fatty-acid amide hydrolase 2-A [Araneus ventricosus]